MVSKVKPEPRTREEAEAIVLEAGTHAGKTIAEVVTKFPEYAKRAAGMYVGRLRTAFELALGLKKEVADGESEDSGVNKNSEVVQLPADDGGDRKEGSTRGRARGGNRDKGRRSKLGKG